MEESAEQQLKDPVWWSEYAPEDATHYDIGDGAPNAWMKKEGDYWYAWTISGKWSEYAADVIEVQTDFFPRPTKPEPCRVCEESPCGHYNECPPEAPRPSKPSEAGLNGEMPDDGELVVVADEKANPGVYFLCEFQSDGPRFQEHPKGGCFYPDEISGWTGTGIVVRTQADRERDDLLTDILGGFRKSRAEPASTPELNLLSEFANYLYDAGMLRKGASDER
ncbi:hypothetical protein [uncultured Marinobacter sp.]